MKRIIQSGRQGGKTARSVFDNLKVSASYRAAAIERLKEIDQVRSEQLREFFETNARYNSQHAINFRDRYFIRYRGRLITAGDTLELWNKFEQEVKENGWPIKQL